MSFQFPNRHSREQRKDIVNERIQVWNDFHTSAYTRAGTQLRTIYQTRALVRTYISSNHSALPCYRSKTYTSFNVCTWVPACYTGAVHWSFFSEQIVRSRAVFSHCKLIIQHFRVHLPFSCMRNASFSKICCVFACCMIDGEAAISL